MKSLFLMLTVILIITGCSVITEDASDTGRLRIVNNSPDSVWVQIESGPEIILQVNESIEQSWNLPTNETQEIEVEYWNEQSNVITINKIISPGSTRIHEIKQEPSLLHINNQTTWDVRYQIDLGTTQELEHDESDELQWDLLEYEEISVNILYEGNHVFSKADNITVIGGETINFNVEADAGGLVILNNFPEINIIQVYLSPAEDVDWGDNDLEEMIQPGESEFWTLEPGVWDIRINLDDGNSFDYLNWNIIIDATIPLTIGG